MVAAVFLVLLNIVLVGLNLREHGVLAGGDSDDGVTTADTSNAPTGSSLLAPTTLAPSSGTGAGTDTSRSTAAAMQAEIDRVLAATPLIFETGQSTVTDLHKRILNNVALIFQAYPGAAVKVIGHTDSTGAAETNLAVSTARAAAVKAYLVDQGVSPDTLLTEAMGASDSTGSKDLAGLERRVTLEVVDTGAVAPAAADVTMRIGVVAPSARNDLAFTQSMIDAINVVATERGGVQVDITDNTFVPAEAAAAIRTYAEEGYNLIIAHGVEFGPELVEIVKAHPNSVFAWGTATDTFGLPNLYAYDAAAEQGGYVMGAMAAMLSKSGTVGVVGPIEVADAKRYIEGFKAGASAQKPGINLPVKYTGSFGDIALAAEAAQGHMAAGADVLTGTAEMVTGAISAAQQQGGVVWFGTQANQASLAPTIVVASQVYHWEVLLRPIVADIDAGIANGRSQVATLADGGLVIEYNPGYALPDDVKARGENLIADIKAGAVAVPTPGP
ncbi:MAG: BMP family ABC transporter substrate-binding protein [Acidimicrobiales bacterium]